LTQNHLNVAASPPSHLLLSPNLAQDLLGCCHWG